MKNTSPNYALSYHSLYSLTRFLSLKVRSFESPKKNPHWINFTDMFDVRSDDNKENLQNKIRNRRPQMSFILGILSNSILVFLILLFDVFVLCLCVLLSKLAGDYFRGSSTWGSLSLSLWVPIECIRAESVFALWSSVSFDLSVEFVFADLIRGFQPKLLYLLRATTLLLYCKYFCWCPAL